MQLLPIGTKVLMKKSIAKWYLDHPEIYSWNGSQKDFASIDYQNETLLHLMCLFGCNIIGTINRYGNDCYSIKWNTGGVKASYLIDRKDFIVVDK